VEKDRIGEDRVRKFDSEGQEEHALGNKLWHNAPTRRSAYLTEVITISSYFVSKLSFCWRNFISCDGRDEQTSVIKSRTHSYLHTAVFPTAES